jgi:hypothetical protein
MFGLGFQDWRSMKTVDWQARVVLVEVQETKVQKGAAGRLSGALALLRPRGA